MTSFVDAASSYPTLIYTVLLGVVLFYWLLALVGVVDIDSSGLGIHTDLHTDLHTDASADDVGDLATYLVALGLNGVPFSVVVTLMVVFAWTISCLAGMWLLPLVPTTLLRVLAGSVVLVASFATALPTTARAIRPMRGLFVTHRALSKAALVGRQCVVLTNSVTGDFGRAEVNTRGAGLNIRVWADTPNELTKGSRATIVEYDANGERYLIVGDP